MKTKYYDKEMYARNESIKGALVVILSFILGFTSGCMAMNIEKQEYITKLEAEIKEKQNTINEQYIELDALGETLYIYELYNKK